MTNRLRLTVHGALATACAALSLSAVFSDLHWLLPVLGGVLLVATTAELVRRTPVPAFLGPLLAAVVMLFYVTGLYTAAAAYADVVPTGASLRLLGDLARSGFRDIRNLATPVPSHSGLVLLTVVGLAAVELVVDLFAVTLRRAALAGLPLLAVFALCTSVSKHGVGWLPFGITTIGYLWLLLADSRDRITRWGRTLGIEQGTRVTWADTDVAPSPLSALGRRIGATAIAVGVVVPMLIPGLHGGLPKQGGGGNGAGQGTNDFVTVNPIVKIQAQLTSARATPIMSVKSSDPNPGYLRLTSLDRFDGNTFSPSTLSAGPEAKVSRGIASPSAVGTEVSTNVTVSNLDVHWLPLPTQVESVKVSGDWRFDPGSNTVFSAKSDTRDLTFSALSERPDLTAAALEGAAPVDANALAQYLALPTDISEDVNVLATTITAKAHTPFDQAVAIQSFLTGPAFTYDTSVAPVASSSSLRTFLIVTRRGFCQQFAASMAVLARILGIPSRVAVGFTHGTRQPDGRWLVTTHDVHAWPELYFDGFGWVAFEPTPRGDGQAVAPSYTRTSSSSSGSPDQAISGKSSAANNANKSAADSKGLDTIGGGAGSVGSPATAKGASGSHLLLLVLLALVLLALPMPALARAVGRAQRWRRGTTTSELAHAAWTELRACTIDARGAWHDGLTPRATARLLASETVLTGAELAALNRLVEAEQRARYAAAVGDRTGLDLRADVDRVRTALFADRGAGERLLLHLWPRSTMRSIREVTGRIADVLDAVDLGGARLSAWLRVHSPRHA